MNTRMTPTRTLCAIAAAVAAAALAIGMATGAQADIVALNSVASTNGRVVFVTAGPGFGSIKSPGQNAAADIVAADRAETFADMDFHTANGASAYRLSAPAQSVHQGPGPGSVKSPETDRR